MNKILIIFLVISTQMHSQNSTYNLMLQNPCSKEIENGLLFHLERLGDTFYVSDSLGTVKLTEPGKYKLEASLYGIEQYVEIQKGKNIDTLFTRRIKECLEPISRPNFIGFCCCDEKCDGYQKDYYNNGKLRMEGEFRNGLAIGKIKTYYPNGKVEEIRFYNEEGLLTQTELYDENGEKK